MVDRRTRQEEQRGEEEDFFPKLWPTLVAYGLDSMLLPLLSSVG